MPIRIELSHLLEDTRIGRFQLAILAWCFLVLIIDGFDTQAIGYVAPLLISHLGVGRGAFGPVFGAGLGGIFAGALLLGAIADRYGRKPAIIGGLTLFGLCTLATVFVGSVQQLCVLRFVTGLGLGGAMPNAIALMTEYAPRNRRAFLATVMVCGFSVGAALGGFLAAELIELFGSSSVFLFGGILPFAILPFLVFKLPESLRFLALKGGDARTIRSIAARMRPDLAISPDAVFVTDEPDVPGFPVRSLFTDGRGRFTLLLWCAFATNLMVLYFVISWTPTLISAAGMSVRQGVFATSLFQVDGAVGTIGIGRLVDRFGPFALLIAFVGAPITLMVLGVTADTPGLLLAILTVLGACVVGGQSGMNVFTGIAYPTSIRSTGAGWALGIGRVGSVAGSMIGGVLVGGEWSLGDQFLLAALSGVPPLLRRPRLRWPCR